jgi:Na+-translocating ferredoxin:NAD+ oxidoreductase RnfG subunit
MTIDLTQIILAVITLIGAVLTRYVIPWIKSKLDEKQYDAFNRLVRVGVFAAEQLANTGKIQDKKQYVLDLLKENGYKIDDESVNALIEATVKELKIELQK